MPPKNPPKKKLVERLVDEGLIASREIAEKRVLAGLVRVDGQVVDKPGTQVSVAARIVVEGLKEYVGRAAHKLAAALDAFSLSPQGLVCVDVGACTGGFTEVLLLRGAERVYAIDVGYGDLDWKIRSDPRVVVMERTNVRHVESLPEPISLVSIDVSFISLSKVLPVVARWLVPEGVVVALVKPQFEAARDEVGEGGIITDPAVHSRVLREVIEVLTFCGLEHGGTVPSPILGTEGNKEFLIWGRVRALS
jgi:23S rRNA (cytidine1920-2'-O)/16S rRNA (cytidine1409-2'-O)-methyltransferase